MEEVGSSGRFLATICASVSLGSASTVSSPEGTHCFAAEKARIRMGRVFTGARGAR